MPSVSAVGDDSVGLESLQDPGERYTLGKCIGDGVSSQVYEAVDNEAAGKMVAVKVVKFCAEYEPSIKEELRILRDVCDHPNLPIFYGAYKKEDDIWFVMQLCDGGSVSDIVRGMVANNRYLHEEHIAYILKEIVNVLCYLHERHIIHRDIKASNILLTKNGDIKLVDFGLSRQLKGAGQHVSTCIGSPCWMAPELIVSNRLDGQPSYDNRIDVWALGITAIELGDGKAPFEGMHPTRAIFQIVRNPPPSFRIPSKWSQQYTDFVTECLVKNPEERPFIFEFTEHPFLASLPGNASHFGKELVLLAEQAADKTSFERIPEVLLKNGKLQEKLTNPPERLVVEDLAALDVINEDTVLATLQSRYEKGLFYTFAGDILIYLNTLQDTNSYGPKYHMKYMGKCRSENSPHIYSQADGAYQDMLHNKEPQHIILSGNTASGKTTNYHHFVEHLIFLAGTNPKIAANIRDAKIVIESLGNAITPSNSNSTRHALNAQFTFTKTGRLSGAVFWMYMLEKWRVTGLKESGEGNFHIFYYLLDGLSDAAQLDEFHLSGIEKFQYLPKMDTYTNAVEKYKQFFAYLSDNMDLDEKQITTIKKILAAVLLLGEISFVEQKNGSAEIENPDLVSKIASLLGVDEPKFAWSLCNYCIVEKGNALKRNHSVAEANEAKHVLARGLYQRLVDWIVNIVNLKLSLFRAMLGDKYYISIMDVPGFDSTGNKGMEKLLANTLNEQLQYFFTQRTFAWQMKEQEEEGLVLPAMQYYDNKPTLDELLNKPNGLLHYIDEATRNRARHTTILDNLEYGTRVTKQDENSFTVVHYAGKVDYTAVGLPLINADFLPPEMIESMRTSRDGIVRELFNNQMTDSGNLTISSEQNITVMTGKKQKWGAALVSGKQTARKFNTEQRGKYSQTRRLRTSIAIFRACCLEILKSLAGNSENANLRFIRCIAPGAEFTPGLVRKQLRALTVVDAAYARQTGYCYRVAFPQFIERYKFLAFDFGENVDLTRDNCRLFLIRMKMEGWILGSSKVFLRYYDEEYLTRLYETQVKKIIKVQAMMRSFLTKRKVIVRVKSQQSFEGKDRRGMRSTEINHIESENGVELPMSEEQRQLVQKYYKKWRMKSVYEILLLYRAHKLQEFSYFAQQVHLYNVNATSTLLAQMNKERVNLSNIKACEDAAAFLGTFQRIVFRVPFTLNNYNLYDTHFLYDPMMPKGSPFGEEESWDSPLSFYSSDSQARQHCITRHVIDVMDRSVQVNRDLINLDPTSDEFVMNRNARMKENPANTRELDVNGNLVECGNSVNGSQRNSVVDDENTDLGSRRNTMFKELISSLSNSRKGSAEKDNPRQLTKKVSFYNLNDALKTVAEMAPVDRRNGVLKMVPEEKQRLDSERGYSNERGNVRNFDANASARRKQADTIVELKIKGVQQKVQVAPGSNDDEPPFNFQAMLRKTSIKRGSLRRHSSSIGSADVVDNCRNSIVLNKLATCSRRASVLATFLTDNSDEYVKTELFPGLLLQGSVFDL